MPPITEKLLTTFMVALCLMIVLAAALYAAAPAFAADGPTPSWVTDAGAVVAAPAAPAVAPTSLPPGALPDFGDDPGAYAKATLAAVRAGKWIVAAGLVILALVWLARRYIGEVFPWLKSDRGGVVLTLATAFLAQLAVSMTTDVPFSASMFLAALAAAWTASGGWSQLRRLFNPPDKVS